MYHSHLSLCKVCLHSVGRVAVGVENFLLSKKSVVVINHKTRRRIQILQWEKISKFHGYVLNRVKLFMQKFCGVKILQQISRGMTFKKFVVVINHKSQHKK